MDTATDPQATARRAQALDAYYAQNVLDATGAFICQRGPGCSASALKRENTGFFPAQGTAVGAHYDLIQEGTPLRILVVAMETGRERSGVSVAQRTAEIGVRAEQPWKSWNPLMRGVGLALRLAFGVPLGDDDAGLVLDTSDGPVHMVHAFAMANLLLCSAVELGTPNSRSTPRMRRNCLPHLVATLGILQPTLVISQGKTLSEPLRSAFTVIEELSPTLAVCSAGGQQFVWADLHHPTHHWDWLARAYLHDVVEPTLKQARALALQL